MFDAYTVKKVLPRLAIAVILIQLSWFIFTGMITLTTAIAYGVEGLIYSPFGGSGEFTLSALLGAATPSAGITGGGNGLFFYAAVAGGAGLALFGGLGVILSLVATAFIAILMGFALLMFRQILIVALLLISPIALVAWILPNTEKLWKMWWESFSKLLIVFPMIVALIAVGRVFAFLTSGVRPGEAADNLLSDIGVDTIIRLVFVVLGFFGPYFLIPKLFVLAGSAFAFFAGMANDRSRGVFDRLKKGRQQTAAKKLQDLRTGERFKERTRFGSRLNAISRGVATGPRGRFGLGQRGNAATSNVTSQAADAFKQTDTFKTNANNDPLLQALASGSSHGEAVRNLQRTFGYSEAEAQRLAREAGAVFGGFSQAKQVAAAEQLVATGTGYSNNRQMVETLATASGGNTALASRLSGYSNATAKQVGRFDLAPGFTHLNDLVHREAGIAGSYGMRGREEDGGGENATGDLNAAPTEAEYVTARVEGSRAGDPVTLLRGKTPQVTELMESLERDIGRSYAVLQDPASTIDDRQAAQAKIDRASQQAHLLHRNVELGYASDANAEVVRQFMGRMSGVLTESRVPAHTPDPDSPLITPPSDGTPGA